MSFRGGYTLLKEGSTLNDKLSSDVLLLNLTI